MILGHEVDSGKKISIDLNKIIEGRMLIQANSGCLPLDEYIYTPNGVVQVKDVYDGLQILGGYVKEPYIFDDELFEVDIGKMKFIASGEHPLWVTKDLPFRHNINQEKWITVNEIYENYSKRNPNNKWYVQTYKENQFKIN